MLNAHIGLVLIAPLLLTVSNHDSPLPASRHFDATVASARFKCRNSSQAKALMFVDGRLVSEDSLTHLVKSADSLQSKDSAVELISVTCMNSRDSTELPTASPLPGIPVVSAWTKTGPLLQVRKSLEAIRELQQAQFEKSSSYRRDVTSLPAARAEVKFTFESTATGWNAVAWADRTLSPRCHLFGGDDKTGGFVGFPKRALAEGEISCE